jgi:hypothetical protein
MMVPVLNQNSYGGAHMRRSMITLVLATLLVGAVAAKARFTSTWKAPGAQGVSFAGKKVVGLIVHDDMNLRMSAEEALARELTNRGLQGVAAYRLIPKEEIKDPKLVKAWFDRAGAAGVVMMRLIDLTKEKIPSQVVWQSATYYDLWSYYPYSWGAVYEIVPARTEIKFIVETTIFDVAAGRMVWAGTSESTNPKGVQTLVKDIVEAAGAEMKKDGLVSK